MTCLMTSFRADIFSSHSVASPSHGIIIITATTAIVEHRYVTFAGTIRFNIHIAMRQQRHRHTILGGFHAASSSSSSSSPPSPSLSTVSFSSSSRSCPILIILVLLATIMTVTFNVQFYVRFLEENSNASSAFRSEPVVIVNSKAVVHPSSPLAAKDGGISPSSSPLTWPINYTEFLHVTKSQLIQSKTTQAWSNSTTYAFARRHFIAGFRNQIMSLTMLILKARQEERAQILLDSLLHKDTYGTNLFSPFEFYFDVEHWNQHHSVLPRLVYFDPTLHSQWNPQTQSYHESILNGTTPTKNVTRPYGYAKGSTRLAAAYQRYVKGNGKYVGAGGAVDGGQDGVDNTNNTLTTGSSQRNPAEIVMLQGALRPHPALQDVLDNIKSNMMTIAKKNTNNDKKTITKLLYMTLHARVEPDMQRHLVCKDKKVLKLQAIVDMVETTIVDGASKLDVVFLPINRQYLEQEGIVNGIDAMIMEGGNTTTTTSSSSSTNINWIAVENLATLNRLRTHGMWNGTVPVVEFGSNALKGTVYEHRPSTAGAILNYFLGLEADIFVGTEVSSFSHDLLATRFFRGRRDNNYKYLPNTGLLESWITPDVVDPPGHVC